MAFAARAVSFGMDGTDLERSNVIFGHSKFLENSAFLNAALNIIGKGLACDRYLSTDLYSIFGESPQRQKNQPVENTG